MAVQNWLLVHITTCSVSVCLSVCIQRPHTGTTAVSSASTTHVCLVVQYTINHANGDDGFFVVDPVACSSTLASLVGKQNGAASRGMAPKIGCCCFFLFLSLSSLPRLGASC
ncbi:hypothetical protein LX32DRAFT_231139 [Colletotrichum zoysiae]|uniref:Secreted protein n=1 Tax=Colletotrichum zoysiae TaxID=1216348 RepID=A0AAD9H481_9PEZI|nr:hypothetical protein LX32DRAFT_231139 [Colletotrichum zoysiae]